MLNLLNDLISGWRAVETWLQLQDKSVQSMFIPKSGTWKVEGTFIF